MSFIPGVGAIVPTLFVAFAVAALAALVLTPAVRRFSRAFGLVDRPDERRVNLRPIPRGGGLAVLAAFVGVAVVVVVMADRRVIDSVVIPPTVLPTELGALLLGGLVAGTVGFLDDVLQIRARWQLIGQLGVAVLAVALGVEINSIANPIGPGTIALRDVYAWAFTIVWIVGMINSINFIDGLDGLSSGISLIAAVTLGLISLTTAVGPFGQPFIAVLCFVLAGALLGFLRWNFHPASIFLGTSGVMFIGYTLAVLSILGTAKVAVALLVLGVPIIDTFWIIVRRILSGRSPFTPDRGHVHHRLLDLGLGHTQIVLLIYAITAALAALTFLLSGADQLYAFLGVVLASGIVLFLLTSRDTVQEDLEADSYEAPAHRHDTPRPDRGDATPDRDNPTSE
jgi:UDP-GlcNAc:undecaprenyl-phosphate/decaprenyl-phosphate GlcNAc-1-phosphate transferase